jgi:hypothetical protein
MLGSSLTTQMHKFFLPRYTTNISLSTDVDSFATNPKDWNPSHTLFTIFLGVNDLAMHYGRSPDPATPGCPLPEVFEIYLQRLQELYAIGARNFMLMTVPPFDRSLKICETGDEHVRRAQLVADIAGYNARIYDMASQFKEITTAAAEDDEGSDDSPAANNSITVRIFDTHRLYSAALSNPLRFPQTASLVDTTSICQEVSIFGTEEEIENADTRYWTATCTDGGKILDHAWTYLHSTARMQDLTGARVWEDCLRGEARGFCGEVR